MTDGTFVRDLTPDELARFVHQSIDRLVALGMAPDAAIQDVKDQVDLAISEADMDADRAAEIRRAAMDGVADALAAQALADPT